MAGDIPNNIIIIQKGVVEVYTQIKGSDFGIEYLGRGSVINHNIFLFGNPSIVPIKCLTTVQVLMLSLEKVNMIRKKNQ